MTDEIPEFETGVLEDYTVHKKELRRSTEISTGFYDKLAALNAGSIAISVSVGLAILNKQDLRQFSHGLLGLNRVLLGVSAFGHRA